TFAIKWAHKRHAQSRSKARFNWRSPVTFEDHFSKLAAAYAAHRPGYPAALFAYLAALAPARDLAWDCGAGNGQAAVSLVAHFAQVVATDASAQQIARAFPH